jgi:hypothetical protein
MPDAMWEKIRLLLPDYETCLLGGRPRRDLRSVADAIFYRLPPLRLERSEEKKGKIVRRWSDLFWQAFGMERSLNFDENGDLRARRR